MARCVQSYGSWKLRFRFVNGILVDARLDLAGTALALTMANVFYVEPGTTGNMFKRCALVPRFLNPRTRLLRPYPGMDISGHVWTYLSFPCAWTLGVLHGTPVRPTVFGQFWVASAVLRVSCV
jgi:hypothetical protein